MSKQAKILPAPDILPPKRRCRHCYQEIADMAKVCHHCHRPQNWFRNLLRYSDLISIVILFISVVQLIVAFDKQQDASEAYLKAQLALDKAISTEAGILEAKRDVLEVSEATVQIVEILPRATGYGAGLTNQDRAKLKELSDFLKLKVQAFNKLEH